jgi:hypothetical protein
MAEEERDLSICPKCGAKCVGSGEPFTVNGWYGDICYGWGRYAGVGMALATRYRCRKCDLEWSAEPDWD